MKEFLKQKKGITLIALVITIIVLLILAGVSIAMLTGDNGIITQAQRAKEETEKSAEEEASQLEQIKNELTGESYLKSKGVNVPDLLTGMTKVSFILPEGTTKGEVVKSGDSRFDENNWYDYKTGKWANAVTQDGSYWVWIPRFAYKIDKEKQTIDVKFLINTTDQYYDNEGNIQTAKRAKSKNEEVDTSKDYYVHPAFTDESNINYANGGWDEELTGIWVAKFEAGFASGNNSSEVKSSNVNYTAKTVIESLDGKQSMKPAKNWLNGEFGNTTTSIKYPVFQPKTYSMNYNTINDAYNISRALTDSGNIYGLSSSSTDSHLMKNSEWGAVVYLAWSKYGVNGIEPYVNNITLNNSVKDVYAVTGVTTGSTNDGGKNTTIDNINGTSGNTANDGVYTWEQLEGQKASTTSNMYGIYDFSGGLWELTSGYVDNQDANLEKYGLSLAYAENVLKTESTKYTTVYPFDSSVDNTEIERNTSNLDIASKANYAKNKSIFGDAIRETSTDGIGNTSWKENPSYLVALNYSFTYRGGSYANNSGGLFSFHRTEASCGWDSGFRTVLVNK